ncbi:MAG TPA: hypothetical protein VHM19_23170 [Polyangiales bacterium]|nr:hypothetical protein [Polyangiales bacterium]
MRGHLKLEGARLYQRLSEQVAAATGAVGYDVQRHLQDWAWIGEQPAEQWTRVLQYIAADPWCRSLENRAKVSPSHIRGRWPVYCEPPKPGAAPPRPVTREERAELFKRLRAELLAARERKAGSVGSARSEAEAAASAAERAIVEAFGPDALDRIDGREPSAAPAPKPPVRTQPANDPEADLAAYRAEQAAQRSAG